MGRTPRPAEDAVLHALRKELEPHGFRYKARKLTKQLSKWCVLVQILRARWIEPQDEIFTILVEYQSNCSDGDEMRTIISLVDAIRDGMYYGEAGFPGGPTSIDPEELIGDFRRVMLPIILTKDDPELFARAFLANDFSPGIPHWLSKLDRAHQAYQWAECLGLDDLRHDAVELMRDLACDPSERDAVEFMWQTLDLPGSPV